MLVAEVTLSVYQPRHSVFIQPDIGGSTEFELNKVNHMKRTISSLHVIGNDLESNIAVNKSTISSIFMVGRKMIRFYSIIVNYIHDIIDIDHLAHVFKTAIKW